MKSALVYFTEISESVGHIGGSEVLLFLVVKELQNRGYNVTIALRTSGDVARGAKDYGVEIDIAKIKVLNLSACGSLLRIVDRHMKNLWRWRLRRLGPMYDVCISCANPVDFGRPGAHFVYMLTLDEKFKSFYWREYQGKWVSLLNQLLYCRDWVLALLSGIRMPVHVVRNPREVVLANSNYVKACIETYYKCSIHDTFYPPTTFEPCELQTQRNNDIACLGRIGFEKRIIEIINIVLKAREMSGINFVLRLAGRCPDSEYGARIRFLAEKYSWLSLEGPVVGEKKGKFLSSCRFAIHACTVEAFGISITEYLKEGIVPIVPRLGGSSEIVALDDLTYDKEDDAAHILVRLAQDKEFYNKCIAHCRNRATLFSCESYLARQKKLFDELCE